MLNWKLEKKNDQNVKININFYDLMANVFESTNIIQNYKNIKLDDIELSLCWPLLNHEIFFLNSIEDDQFNKFINSIPLFVDNIVIKNKTFDFKNLNFEQKKELKI